jgi:DNA-binding NarL/FixJ family response regulator
MLVCSMHPDSLYAERALRAGALGYINKENTTGRILDAIRSVRDGEIYLSEYATRRLVHRTIGHIGNSGLTLESLSDRELEIFKLIGEGRSTGDMAGHLHLSVHTVDTYRRRIRLKLNTRNGAELIRTATEWSLVEPKNPN